MSHMVAEHTGWCPAAGFDSWWLLALLPHASHLRTSLRINMFIFLSWNSPLLQQA